MKTMDEARLETDLEYRFAFLMEFVGFTPEDAAALQGTAPYLGPLVPSLVERTYEKLLAYDATARHFVPRQHGLEGQPAASLQNLSRDHSHIQFRKEHLMRYLMQIMGRSLDARIIPYLEMVGKIHTPRAGNRDISVPLVQMNAFMGVLSDLLFETITSLGLDSQTTLSAIRAWNKFLWIQNDFISRQYQAAPTSTT
ncbi:MAG: protoglobin family protein [Gemmataceae bacterium]